MKITGKLREVYHPTVSPAFEVMTASGGCIGPLKDPKGRFGKELCDMQKGGALDVEMTPIVDGGYLVSGTTEKPLSGVLILMDSNQPRTKVISRPRTH